MLKNVRLFIMLSKPRIKSQRAKATRKGRGRMPQPIPAANHMRMGPYRPTITQRGNKVLVKNREIFIDLAATFATGSAPSITIGRTFGFVNSTGTPSSSGRIGTIYWLQQIARCWDKYRVLEATLQYVASAAFTYSGQVGLYWDPDPTATIPPNFASVSANRFSVSSQVSQPSTLRLPRECFNRLPWYDTTTGAADNTDGICGTMVAVSTPIMSPLPAQTGNMSLGVVWMEYTIEFEIPSNPVTQTAPTFRSQDSAELQEIVKAVIASQMASQSAAKTSYTPAAASEFAIPPPPNIPLTAPPIVPLPGSASSLLKIPELDDIISKLKNFVTMTKEALTLSKTPADFARLYNDPKYHDALSTAVEGGLSLPRNDVLRLHELMPITEQTVPLPPLPLATFRDVEIHDEL